MCNKPGLVSWPEIITLSEAGWKEHCGKPLNKEEQSMVEKYCKPKQKQKRASVGRKKAA